MSRHVSVSRKLRAFLPQITGGVLSIAGCTTGAWMYDVLKDYYLGGGLTALSVVLGIITIVTTGAKAMTAADDGWDALIPAPPCERCAELEEETNELRRALVELNP